MKDYQVFLIDLDGTVYRGKNTVESGVRFVHRLIEQKKDELTKKRQDKKELYFCSGPLQNQYDPYKCTLKREYYIVANEKGEFYFMVPDLFAKTGVVEIEKVGIEEKGQVLIKQFYEGKDNKLEVIM